MQRKPLAYGKGEDWGVVMHNMLSWEKGDHGPVPYGQLCRDGGELAVFVTEPCAAKAHAPSFDYYREGRLITHFSFEDPSRQMGEQPELLESALTAAQVIRADAVLGDDDDERIVQAIAACLALPELAMP